MLSAADTVFSNGLVLGPAGEGGSVTTAPTDFTTAGQEQATYGGTIGQIRNVTPNGSLYPEYATYDAGTNTPLSGAVNYTSLQPGGFVDVGATGTNGYPPSYSGGTTYVPTQNYMNVSQPQQPVYQYPLQAPNMPAAPTNPTLPGLPLPTIPISFGPGTPAAPTPPALASIPAATPMQLPTFNGGGARPMLPMMGPGQNNSPMPLQPTPSGMGAPLPAPVIPSSPGSSMGGYGGGPGGAPMQPGITARGGAPGSPGNPLQGSVSAGPGGNPGAYYGGGAPNPLQQAAGAVVDAAGRIIKPAVDAIGRALTPQAAAAQNGMVPPLPPTPVVTSLPTKEQLAAAGNPQAITPEQLKAAGDHAKQVGEAAQTAAAKVSADAQLAAAKAYTAGVDKIKAAAAQNSNKAVAALQDAINNVKKDTVAQIKALDKHLAEAYKDYEEGAKDGAEQHAALRARVEMLKSMIGSSGYGAAMNEARQQYEAEQMRYRNDPNYQKYLQASNHVNLNDRLKYGNAAAYRMASPMARADAEIAQRADAIYARTGQDLERQLKISQELGNYSKDVDAAKKSIWDAQAKLRTDMYAAQSTAINSLVGAANAATEAHKSGNEAVDNEVKNQLAHYIADETVQHDRAMEDILRDTHASDENYKAAQATKMTADALKQRIDLIQSAAQKRLEAWTIVSKMSIEAQRAAIDAYSKLKDVDDPDVKMAAAIKAGQDVAQSAAKTLNGAPQGTQQINNPPPNAGL